VAAQFKFPNVAPWFGMACDLPLMDLTPLKQLIAFGTGQKDATAFASA